MSVYDRSYKGYRGAMTPALSRWSVLARYALQDVFQSRWFVAFFVLCFVPPLVCAVLIYLRYNVEALSILDLSVLEVIKVDAAFFFNFVYSPQSVLAFVVILVVGPALISPDLRNNALPLLLSRPLSKTDYVVGKFVVLFGLASLVTWVPALALFLLQAYLADNAWRAEHWHLLFGIPMGFAVTIGVQAVWALAVSAWVKWKPWARIAFLGSILIAGAVGQVFKLLYETWWGSVMVLNDLTERVVDGLFGIDSTQQIPLTLAWLCLLAFAGLSLMILYRRIRAFEVIS